MGKEKVKTELETLKQKCLKADGQPKADATGKDLARLKQLQDGEPISKAELAEAKKREAENKAKDIADYKARKAAEAGAVAGQPVPQADPALNLPPAPAEHPRIAALKTALLPFTQLTVHESRSDDFILMVIGGTITAGDVRAATRAMQI